jgi:hypothetical protein
MTARTRSCFRAAVCSGDGPTRRRTDGLMCGPRIGDLGIIIRPERAFSGLYNMVQRGELCLFLSKKAGQHLTLRLIGLDGKLSAEVLDVCSDELVHNERASNAPTLRPQVRASRRSLTGEPGVLDKSAGRQRKGQPHGPARIETARTGSTSRVTLPRVAI